MQLWMWAFLPLLALVPLTPPRPVQKAIQKPLPVIAYLPDYRVETFLPATAAYLTDLIYFSIEPTPSGELKTTRLTPEVQKRLVEIKKSQKVRVLVAIGGWERSQGFAPMAAHPEARSHFVQALLALCQKNHFDGVDFDWEHPANKEEEVAYATLLVETKLAFQPYSLLVSVTLADWQNLEPRAFSAVDRIQIMAYDHDEARHSTYERAIADVETFVKRGAPKEKLVLGIPFYGRNLQNRNQTMTYADIVKQFHPKPEEDEAGGIYFNGIQTVQRKARYVKEQGLGGIMIWEPGQDTNEENSLLRAIHHLAVKR